MKTKITSGIFLLAMLILSGCAKDKYQPKGDYQPAGNYGNANMIYSNTVTLNNWTSAFDNGTEYVYYSLINWPALTQAIKDNGAVMTYVQSGTQWYALPYSDHGTGWSYTYDFGFDVGTVEIDLTGVDNTGSPGTASQNGTVVRLVAISPAAKIANPDLNWSNYNEVKARFNLED